MFKEKKPESSLSINLFKPVSNQNKPVAGKCLSKTKIDMAEKFIYKLFLIVSFNPINSHKDRENE